MRERRGAPPPNARQGATGATRAGGAPAGGPRRALPPPPPPAPGPRCAPAAPPPPAPAATLREEAGRPLRFGEASAGGRAGATPGVRRMLEMAHRPHGRLPWSRLSEPAMRLAESGFTITPRLHKLIEDNPQLREMPGAAAYFYDKSLEPRAVGQRLENPHLFETLRLIASGGAGASYS